MKYFFLQQHVLDHAAVDDLIYKAKYTTVDEDGNVMEKDMKYVDMWKDGSLIAYSLLRKEQASKSEEFSFD